MEIVVALDNHFVYRSVFRTLEYTHLGRVRQFERYKENLRCLFRSPTFHIQSLKLNFSRENIYVLNSPLFAEETWAAANKGISTIIMEEYFYKSRCRDEIVKFILRKFKSHPFIAMTKRTDLFLSESGLNSFLVPPATEKRRGRRTRDIILFVGRMIESKNPFFILDLAKRLKNENFVMIGQGSLSDKIKEKARNQSNVKIIDSIDNERLFSDFYSRAKVVLHPARKDPIGFTMIEALSVSTPVLASASTGASDYLPRAWVFNDYDLDRWANGIKGINSEDLSVARQIFEEEHLNINDKYFKSVAKSLRKSLTG